MKTIFWLILLVTVALPASASFQFAGEDADPASNLIYLRGRYYDPQTGTFTGKDPLGVAGGLNVYQYVADNPINLMDPLGLDAETPPLANVLEGHAPGQGFTGVFDASNGNVLILTGRILSYGKQ